ncbi:PTS sugar transporter subunit IIC [Enterococcus sp. BWB1-3]|uniref:PTS mannose/fructose/sorbose/N-acetylgalactosamine transporter subunit IIC n=1 Tax=unclassified Enterococcus TaxID=2608891 RepID=UPI0019227F35|nr:PTS sugar transporter subunit IIC [Enterococcus sp. CWB-B31]MBL1229725.1 PTS sugar transporter subunit IIC [Enterococcus sp. BWB1-3]MCB5953873.1 PTS sugar transporter subunit IIC [Enterococcus sp. CWB-B31]
MDITLLIQAIAISVICYLGALSTPWLLGLTGGWYTITRPLVSGMIVGLILGDMKQGIMMGVAIQTVYIAMVTPGGQMPADLNFVAFPAIALAMLSNTSTEVAVTLATTIGILGTIVFNMYQVINSFWNHRAVAAIREGDYKKFRMNAIFGPQLVNFISRFVPSFLVLYFGSGFAKTMLDSMPQYLIDVMSYLGGVLPAIGIAMLLTAVVKENSLFLFFLLGFVCIVFLELNMIALTIVAAVIAYLYFNGLNKNSSVSSAGVVIDEEDEEEF